jgi:hypothetical protein
MGNFVECNKIGDDPISDFYNQHRSTTTCHLANITLRLNRILNPVSLLLNSRCICIVAQRELGMWV